MRLLARLPLFASALLLLLGLGACSSYQLGTGGTTQFSRIFIPPVSSEVLLPQAQAVITTQLREAFLKDGRVTLTESAEEADAILTLRLTGYQRDVSVVRADDTGLARRYDLTLSAKATLADHRTGKTYFTDRTLAAKRGAFTDSGQIQSEYQALPILAEELARQAVHAALDTW